MYKVIYTFLYSLLHYKAQLLSICHCTKKTKHSTGHQLQYIKLNIKTPLKRCTKIKKVALHKYKYLHFSGASVLNLSSQADLAIASWICHIINKVHCLKKGYFTCVWMKIQNFQMPDILNKTEGQCLESWERKQKVGSFIAAPRDSKKAHL